MYDSFKCRRPFTHEDVKNKELVIKMLKYEDLIMLGPVGAAFFSDNTFSHLTDLNTYFTIHRIVLADHGFQTNDSDVANYRSIFSHYYKTPFDYEKDVLSSVCYMRENKCVYYKTPEIKVDDSVPDVELFEVDGVSKSSLYTALSEIDAKYIFVGAFSNS
jgi:hypothetical protein